MVRRVTEAWYWKKQCAGIFEVGAQQGLLGSRAILPALTCDLAPKLTCQGSKAEETPSKSLGRPDGAG